MRCYRQVCLASCDIIKMCCGLISALCQKLRHQRFNLHSYCYEGLCGDSYTAVVLKCGHTCWCRFCVCVPWLPPRSWVCRGQSAICCWGGATQCCQGKQVSVGAAAARPETVHGENDAVPIVMLPLQLIQGVQHLGRGAYHLPTVCLLSLARCLLTSCAILFRALRVEPHHSYDVQQGKAPIFSGAYPDFFLLLSLHHSCTSLNRYN